MKITKINAPTGEVGYLIEYKKFKNFRSKNYNFNFNLESGFFQRWGATPEEDPFYSPFGCEIFDMEVVVNGCPTNCKFCYKGNTSNKSLIRYMTFENFKIIFHKLPKTTGQIAFGISSISANPDLFKIFQYCRDNSVIPNVTISSKDKLTDEELKNVINLCGAVAVSVYDDRDYTVIKQLLEGGLKYVNIHYMISKQSIDTAYKICNDIKTNPDLKKLTAIVFLGLKPKNRGQAFDVLPMGDFDKLISYCLANGVNFGFDSCSAARVQHSVNNNKQLSSSMKKSISGHIEPCESKLFSHYCDVDGNCYPCSFCEDKEPAINLFKVNDYLKEVWHSDYAGDWRSRLSTLCRECPAYPEIHVGK